MSFNIIRSDITKVEADAIVNSANPYPVCGGSTESLIYEAAGFDELLEARKKIGFLDICEARHTPAFNMKAKYLIHVSAPRWNDGRSGEKVALKLCYKNALEKAYKLGCQSIAFPLLSSGIYRFPKPEAISIASYAIQEFLQSGADNGMPDRSSMNVDLVLYDNDSTLFAKRLFNTVQAYIEENYKPEHFGKAACYQANESSIVRRAEEPLFNAEDKSSVKLSKKKSIVLDVDSQIYAEENTPRSAGKKSNCIIDERALEKLQDAPAICRNALEFPKGIKDLFIKPEISKTFSDLICEIINKKNLTPAQVQRDADIDRKLFSKVLKKDYKTTKPTVIALAIGLKLNYQEAREFLAFAGFALSPASKSDVVVQFFMENRELLYRSNPNYDKYKVTILNDLLLDNNLDTLGAGRHLTPLPRKQK